MVLLPHCIEITFWNVRFTSSFPHLWYLSWDVRTCQKSVTPQRASFHATQKWHWPQVLSSTLERISGDNSGITRNATTLASRVTLRGAQMHPQLSVTRTCQAFIPHSSSFHMYSKFDLLFWLLTFLTSPSPSSALFWWYRCVKFSRSERTDKIFLDFG